MMPGTYSVYTDMMPGTGSNVIQKCLMTTAFFFAFALVFVLAFALAFGFAMLIAAIWTWANIHLQLSSKNSMFYIYMWCLEQALFYMQAAMR